MITYVNVFLSGLKTHVIDITYQLYIYNASVDYENNRLISKTNTSRNNKKTNKKTKKKNKNATLKHDKFDFQCSL